MDKRWLGMLHCETLGIAIEGGDRNALGVRINCKADTSALHARRLYAPHVNYIQIVSFTTSV